MLLSFAILAGRTAAFFIKLLSIGGGSAAPGLIALRIFPSLVEKLSRQIKKNIVITGTNGKTTTARMLSLFAKTAGLNVIRNHTGSNLERGIASALIHKSSIINHKSVDLGIWELDEAVFNTVAPKLKPSVVVFLNVFRDQLDRYGEIDTVVKNWCQTLKNLPVDTCVLVNGDDINTLKLAKAFKRKVQKFGVKDYKILGESIEHIKEQENLDFEAKDIKTKGLSGTDFSLHFHHQSSIIYLPIPGIYHIYDFLAAFSAGLQLGLEPKQMISSLKNFSPAFGRVEKLPFGYIFLMKNPAGATQIFETIAPNIKPGDALLFALNDNLADGTDVSWIWDANFESLLMPKNHQISAGVNTIPPQGWTLICSGARAYDLTVRLKYAGADTKQIFIEPNLQKALGQARTDLKGSLFILPTYTAMLQLQSILTKSGIKQHYWKSDD